MKIIYVLPTTNCNLHCPHCDIRTKEDNFDEKMFYKALKENDGNELVMFGGEPTLYRSRLKKSLNIASFTSISTNLLNLDDELIRLYKHYDLSIATSWNLNRFDNNQYNIWINHLNLLSENELNCIIMITMTEDLVEYNIDKFIDMLSQWDNIKSIKEIKFEYLIDNNSKNDLHLKCDEWLCRLDDNWNFHFTNFIKENLNNWNYYCNNVYTLLPNGKMIKGCPHNANITFADECLDCQLVNICKPCRLQSRCSFPKKLYEKVKQCKNY